MRYKLVCEQDVFCLGVQCYLEFRSYLKANYPKSLPLALKSTFAFKIHCYKHLPTPKKTAKQPSALVIWEIAFSVIAQTLKMRRDVKLLYDIMEDTINLQLAKIHVRSTYCTRDEILNSVRSE